AGRPRGPGGSGTCLRNPAVVSSMRPCVRLSCLAAALAAVWLATGRAPAQPGPKVTALKVEPAAVTLHGPRAGQQLIVTATLADGTARDVTRQATWTTTLGTVRVSADGYITAVADGRVQVRAAALGATATADVTDTDVGELARVSFRNEIIPVLNRAGCNQGACHGTPNGKGGFKLSLRGYDIAFDFHALTREAGNRRTNGVEPDQSLILLKATGRVPHQGGVRFQPGSEDLGLLRAWITEGLQDDPESAPAMVRL